MSQDLDRVYTIPLGKVLLSPDNRRAKRAINMIREFARRHMKINDVRIDPEVAQLVWARGIRRPPRSIRVRMERTEEKHILITRYDERDDVGAPSGSGAAAAAADAEGPAGAVGEHEGAGKRGLGAALAGSAVVTTGGAVIPMSEIAARSEAGAQATDGTDADAPEAGAGGPGIEPAATETAKPDADRLDAKEAETAKPDAGDAAKPDADAPAGDTADVADAPDDAAGGGGDAGASAAATEDAKAEAAGAGDAGGSNDAAAASGSAAAESADAGGGGDKKPVD